MPSLKEDLSEYDGKSTDLLHEILADGRPGTARWREAVDLCAGEDPRLAAGASWLFRAWLEAGHPIPGTSLNRLAARLARIEDPWTHQHLCQSLASLEVPAEHAEAFVAFCAAGQQSPRPFLRAWACDGLYRLAQQHPGYTGDAELALQAALEDQAASVRARARRILAGN